MYVADICLESTALRTRLTLELKHYFTWINMGCFESLWVSKQSEVGPQHAKQVLHGGITCFFLNLKQSELP